jgi:hypothetical protein
LDNLRLEIRYVVSVNMLCTFVMAQGMSSIGLYCKDIKLRVLVYYLSFSCISNLNRLKITIQEISIELFLTERL